MRILVTGGSGFIGTNLIDFYSRQGIQVLNLDVRQPRNEGQKNNWRFLDILDKSELLASMKEFQPSHIYHMAARTDLDGNTLEDYAANTAGLHNVITTINEINNVQKVVFASSRLVCEIGYQPKNEEDYCPTTAYGRSKMDGERLVRAAKMSVPWLIVRPTSIWGPWFDTPYKIFFLMIAKNVYFHPAGKRPLKSFGYVGNTVFQLDRLATCNSVAAAEQTMYLGDYPTTDIYEMAKCVQVAMGSKPIKTIPLSLLRLLAKSGDMANTLGWRAPPLTSFRLNNLVTDMIYDLNPLKDIVGPLPYSVEDGIRVTVDWMRHSREIK